ncbi:hypothetical protein ACL02S_13475 [Nocardia sp. 004]|uniref:hypothetical protein n=1 Tax=Nocardia sp. 004 TaxID=3385978 RepID=UPI0039A0D426
MSTSSLRKAVMSQADPHAHTDSTPAGPTGTRIDPADPDLFPGISGTGRPVGGVKGLLRYRWNIHFDAELDQKLTMAEVYRAQTTRQPILRGVPGA